VVPVKDGYGVKFEFDDGYTDSAEVGDKETAEFYARVQLGERIPKGVHPLAIERREGGNAAQTGRTR
jgi:hypothetical protein